MCSNTPPPKFSSPALDAYEFCHQWDDLWDRIEEINNDIRQLKRKIECIEAAKGTPARSEQHDESGDEVSWWAEAC